ncbi:sensor histidine kinase [Rossellomorea sp. BNER]|uniref:sensor histidine kinase n=1 Tax=Rossellomorea sp. BNER TaxID=2962031 RepID=UPI003AF26D44|nr:ATP-binding protein [Rossellomorea sp. BNER]
MTIFLAILVFILVILNLKQYRSQKNQNTKLTYAYEKLIKIRDDKTDEKLLLDTEDESFKKLLIEINLLLEHNQKVIATHHQMENSMKKMLSNISHDLKTPLTVVLGYIEVLLHESNLSKGETDNLLNKVNDKTIEVLNLIKKFFDLARLESGDKDVLITRVNMNEVCKKNLLGFYEIVTKKGFEVIVDLPDENLFVWGNEEELNRVFDNLISNAIQYGGDGKVLGLSLRNDDDFVYVDVWDKGKGISELHKDRVFERMYTLEDSRNKLYQGSGIGLTITKRLVEKLGGEIFLNSKPFEKTTFTFKLNRFTF